MVVQTTPASRGALWTVRAGHRRRYAAWPVPPAPTLPVNATNVGTHNNTRMMMSVQSQANLLQQCNIWKGYVRRIQNLLQCTGGPSAGR
jgi:hypothetical protein